jgi:hypothetical protein
MWGGLDITQIVESNNLTESDTKPIGYVKEINSVQLLYYKDYKNLNDCNTTTNLIIVCMDSKLCTLNLIQNHYITL